MTNGLEKFERLRLLDGLQDYLSGAISPAEFFLALDSLGLTFGVDATQLEGVRNSYLHDFVLEKARSGRYKAPIDFKSLEVAGVSRESATPAINSLLSEGLLRRDSDGTLVSSPDIWKEDLMRFKERLLKMDSELGELIEEKGKDPRRIGWNYETLLEKFPVIIDSLLRFNEPKVAGALEKAVYSEMKHFQKHHAGMWWTQEMIRKFRIFYRQSADRVSPELRVDFSQS